MRYLRAPTYELNLGVWCESYTGRIVHMGLFDYEQNRVKLLMFGPLLP